jgi:hypothetical protein
MNGRTKTKPIPKGSGPTMGKGDPPRDITRESGIKIIMLRIP